MSKIAKKVYLIHRQDEFRAFASSVKEIMSRKNIEFVANSEVKGIIGQGREILIPV